jgi:hypothetical protein
MTALEDYESGALADYRQKLQSYNQTYWPSGGMLTEPAIMTQPGTIQPPSPPNAPAPPPTPDAPVLSGDVQMVTRIVAYNYETQEDRMLFEQVTGANLRTDDVCAPTAQRQLFSVFCGQRLFLPSQRRPVLQETGSLTML